MREIGKQDGRSFGDLWHFLPRRNRDFGQGELFYQKSWESKSFREKEFQSILRILGDSG
jgi:hypothetical protein